MSKKTPWGMSDYEEVLAEGIISYGTPSHGGIWLSKARQDQIGQKSQFLGTAEWWEEDCDWCIPYVFFIEDIRKYGKAYKIESNFEYAKILKAGFEKRAQERSSK